ncbi:MAG: hypothetical protein RL713_1863 [Bacteroidota bacterium]|jgi:hypothetical protein
MEIIAFPLNVVYISVIFLKIQMNVSVPIVFQIFLKNPKDKTPGQIIAEQSYQEASFQFTTGQYAYSPTPKAEPAVSPPPYLSKKGTKTQSDIPQRTTVEATVIGEKSYGTIPAPLATEEALGPLYAADEGILSSAWKITTSFCLYFVMIFQYI